jgi:dTDP-4-dehydrorhamnose 3,5-epimerase-like enzyme
MVKNSKTIILPQIVDGIDGTISVAEYRYHIPFAIKRVYYIYGLINPDAIRGKHAHKNLEQVLFCINGTCEISLDDGEKSQAVVLNKPNVGLYLGKELWVTMKEFSDNCILLVLASDIYEEDDYIRDYDEFIRYVNRRIGKE